MTSHGLKYSLFMIELCLVDHLPCTLYGI